MTLIEELRAAAARLRSGMLVVHADYDLLLAKLLEDCAELHEPNVCTKHEGCTATGCQWCADEDFPCADVRNALAVARQINENGPHQELGAVN